MAFGDNPRPAFLRFATKSNGVKLLPDGASIHEGKIIGRLAGIRKEGRNEEDKKKPTNKPRCGRSPVKVDSKRA